MFCLGLFVAGGLSALAVLVVIAEVRAWRREREDSRYVIDLKTGERVAGPLE